MTETEPGAAAAGSSLPLPSTLSREALSAVGEAEEVAASFVLSAVELRTNVGDVEL